MSQRQLPVSLHGMDTSCDGERFQTCKESETCALVGPALCTLIERSFRPQVAQFSESFLWFQYFVLGLHCSVAQFPFLGIRTTVSSELVPFLEWIRLTPLDN